MGAHSGFGSGHTRKKADLKGAENLQEAIDNGTVEFDDEDHVISIGGVRCVKNSMMEKYTYEKICCAQVHSKQCVKSQHRYEDTKKKDCSNHVPQGCRCQSGECNY